MVTVSIIFDRSAEQKWETAKEEAEVKRAGRARDGEERTVWVIVAYLTQRAFYQKMVEYFLHYPAR